MEAIELQNCCGVCEIGNFYRPVEPTSIVKRIKKVILDHLQDNWSWDYDHYYNKSKKDAYKTTNFFIATTNKDQLYMVEPLESLGFRKRAFNSKHEGLVFFWTRRGLPKEIQKEWNSWVKESLKEFD